MIKVFKGNWRGLNKKDRGFGIILDLGFREIIHHFKGAKLHVFLALCLHADEDGLCTSSYDTLSRETGYSHDAIALALSALCQLRIEENPVLARWQGQNERGQFESNRYLIFPTHEELASIENLAAQSHTEKSYMEKPYMESLTISQTIFAYKPEEK